MYLLLKLVVFHCYISLPEGNSEKITGTLKLTASLHLKMDGGKM